MNNENQIRKLIEDRVAAVHTKNVNALLSNIAPNVLSFDVLNPLHNSGVDKVRERVEKWISTYQSAIGYEIRDLNITSGDEVAFCHYLYHVTGTQTSGSKVDMWVRATECFRKIDGQWLVTHEHQSVPFDPETSRASLNLKL
jgi:uncharacterized protein (TIGR02246 family)